MLREKGAATFSFYVKNTTIYKLLLLVYCAPEQRKGKISKKLAQGKREFNNKDILNTNTLMIANMDVNGNGLKFSCTFINKRKA